MHFMRLIPITSPTGNSADAAERVFRSPPLHLANLFGYALNSVKLSTPTLPRVNQDTLSVIPASVTPTKAKAPNVIWSDYEVSTSSHSGLFVSISTYHNVFTLRRCTIIRQSNLCALVADTVTTFRYSLMRISKV